MATNVLLVVSLITAFCSAYKSRTQIFDDYDQWIEQQEERNLFLNDDADSDFDAYFDKDSELKKYGTIESKLTMEQKDTSSVSNHAEHSHKEIKIKNGILDDKELNGAYSDKTQEKAFLLSFFLGFVGAGRFYVGNYVLAALKLFVPMIGCVVGCIVASIVPSDEDDEEVDRSESRIDNFKNGLKGSLVVGICGCSCCALQIW